MQYRCTTSSFHSLVAAAKKKKLPFQNQRSSHGADNQTVMCFMNQRCQEQRNLFWTAGVRKLTQLSPVGCFSQFLPRRKSSLCKTYFPNSLSWPLPRTPTHPLWQCNCSLDQREFIRQVDQLGKKAEGVFLTLNIFPFTEWKQLYWNKW